MSSGRGLWVGLITSPEEYYRLWCVVVCDLETSRMGAPYIYDISRLRVKEETTKVLHSADFFFLFCGNREALERRSEIP